VSQLASNVTRRLQQGRPAIVMSNFLGSEISSGASEVVDGHPAPLKVRCGLAIMPGTREEKKLGPRRRIN
jgi:hypothetical protein